MAQKKTSTTNTNTKTSTIIPNTTPPSNRTYTISERSLNKKEKQDQKLKQRMHRRQTLQRLAQQDDHFLEENIIVAEVECTATTKASTTEVRRKTINKAHNQSNAKPTASITLLLQNTSYGIGTALKRAAMWLLTSKKQVTFGETHNNNKVEHANTVHLMYDS